MDVGTDTESPKDRAGIADLFSFNDNRDSDDCSLDGDIQWRPDRLSKQHIDAAWFDLFSNTVASITGIFNANHDNRFSVE